MIKAKNEDKSHVSALLCRAFKDNQSVNYIVKHDNIQSCRIKALMDYSFTKCLLFGEVYLSNDRCACALVLTKRKDSFSLQSVWLDLKLIYQAIGLMRIGLALKREMKIKNRQYKGPMIYLWFIGVDPAAQHHGIGSLLLEGIISQADDRQLPICLETSTLNNLPWYERFGFKIYDELDLGYKLYFLIRNTRD